MSNEIYIAYGSGEEPTGPGKSPTLSAIHQHPR
jgi:hypothetical protein